MELNQENYENYLLLYIDNELTATEKAAVEAFLVSQPLYVKELQALQNSVLPSELIQYPDKNSLYRFEEMNAQLDPVFKKSLYKQDSKTAIIINFKKHYVAYLSIAAITIWLVLGVNQFFQNTKPSLSTIEYIPTAAIQIPTSTKRNNIQTAIPKSKTIIAVNKKKEKQDIAMNTTSVIPNTTLFEKEVVADQQPIQVEAAVISPINIENNNTIATETKIEKEIFEGINTEDNDRVIYISNIELDGDKFRGITRRLGAIFKRNKIEKNK